MKFGAKGIDGGIVSGSRAGELNIWIFLICLLTSMLL